MQDDELRDPNIPVETDVEVVSAVDSDLLVGPESVKDSVTYLISRLFHQ